MFSNLSQFAGTLSLLRENIILHFERLVEDLDTTEFLLGDSGSSEERYLKITAIAVEPMVVTQRLLPIPIKFDKDGKKQVEELPKGDVLADLQADIYERPFEAEKYVKELWSRTFANESSVVVKGEPGGGKTFIVKHTTIQIAETAIFKLKNFLCPLEEIELAFFVTANDFAEKFESEGQTLSKLLRKVVKASHGDKKLILSFYDWLETQFEKETGVTIFIDALDEIEGRNEDNFGKVATKLKNFKGKVIFTCRTMRWETQQNLIAWNQITIVSLDLFNPIQREKVIEKFFHKHPAKLKKFKLITEINYSLQHSFSSPLMLTFGCLLYRINEEELNENTTHDQLYEKTIDKLFSGEFAPNDRKPYWTKHLNDDISPDDKTDMLLALFDEISWQLFYQTPESKEFDLVQWNQAFTKAFENIKINHPQIEKISDSLKFRNELLKIRLLLFTKKEKGKQRWSYLHKTFLEFSSARALSKQLNWLDEAKQHFGDKNWLETLTFLAGQLKDEEVKSLISAVRKSPTGIFGWKIFLESRFTGMSNLDEYDIQPICDNVITHLATLYISHWTSKDRYFTDRLKLAPMLIYSPLLKMSHSNLRLSKACKKYLFGNLTAHLINQLPNDDFQPEDISDLIYALSNINDDDDRVIDFLVSLTTDINGDDDDRQTIIEGVCTVLAKLGRTDAKVTNFLFSELPSAHNYRSTSFAVITALRDLGSVDERVADSLISMIEDSAVDGYIRGQAIDALRNLAQANDNVINTLLRLAENEFVHDHLRTQSITVLKTLKCIDQKIIDRLILIATDSSYNYGLLKHIIDALGELGKTDARVLNFLMSVVDNPLQSEKLTEEVIEALGKISRPNEHAIEFLYTAVQNENYVLQTRYKAMVSILNLGVIDDEIMHVLILAAQNPNNSVTDYSSALKVLGNMSAVSSSFNDWIFSFVNYLLMIDDWNLQWEIISTLGKIGGNDDRFLDILFSFLENVASFCHTIDEFYEGEDEDEDEPLASRIQLDYYMVAALFGEAAASVEKIFNKKKPTSIQFNEFLRLVGNCLDFFSKKDLYANQNGNGSNAEIHKSDDFLGVLFRTCQRH